jgi:hypothetical protein
LVNAGYQSILATSVDGIWFRQPSNREQFDLFAIRWIANPADQAPLSALRSGKDVSPIATASGASAASLRICGGGGRMIESIGGG